MTIGTWIDTEISIAKMNSFRGEKGGEKEFYLTIVRHAQTAANELKNIQGHLNTPLTRLGIEQASLLGRFFKTHGPNKFHRVYTSDLGRAQETCKIILSHVDEVAVRNLLQVDKQNSNSCDNIIDSTGSIVCRDTRLRERKYGISFEGKPVNSLLEEAKKYGFDAKTFTRYTPDGAESMEQVRQRVAEFIDTTMLNECEHNEEVLIVSHWATIKELLKLFQPLANGSIKEEHLLESPNTSFCRFKIRNNKSSLTSNDCDQQQQPKLTQATEFWMQKHRSLVSIETISLHQNPHLNSNEISVNLRQQIE